MAGKGQKRKDKDRIVLRTGEGQRPNGTKKPHRRISRKEQNKPIKPICGPMET